MKKHKKHHVCIHFHKIVTNVRSINSDRTSSFAHSPCILEHTFVLCFDVFAIEMLHFFKLLQRTSINRRWLIKVNIIIINFLHNAINTLNSDFDLV